jgi:hypothetical protein
MDIYGQDLHTYSHNRFWRIRTWGESGGSFSFVSPFLWDSLFWAAIEFLLRSMLPFLGVRGSRGGSVCVWSDPVMGNIGVDQFPIVMGTCIHICLRSEEEKKHCEGRETSRTMQTPFSLWKRGPISGQQNQGMSRVIFAVCDKVDPVRKSRRSQQHFSGVVWFPAVTFRGSWRTHTLR